MFTLKPIQYDKLKEFPWQKKTTSKIVEAFHTERTKKGILFRAGTGLGKTHMFADALNQMLGDGSFLQVPPGSCNPFPILVLTTASGVVETQRKLQTYGIGHLCMVMSYSQLCYTGGKECQNMFVSFVGCVDKDGNPDIQPVWNPWMLPAMVICDECQKIRNESSMRTRVIRELPKSVKVIHVSATPYQRIQDARAIVETLDVVTRFNNLKATKETSAWILREIASPKGIEEFSPSAMKRLRNELLPYMVEVKGVRFPFPAHSECVECDFASPQDRMAYDQAVVEWLEELREAGKSAPKSRWGMMMASIIKFRQKCALLRAGPMADEAYISYKSGMFPIVGENFKDALRVIYLTLVKKHGVDKDHIAYIVGGQSQQVRQQMVDDFQSGRRKIMLVMIGAGGESISLHHDNPNTLPRDVLIPATWSAIEMAQLLGRGHRLTSISPTRQRVFWFKDTIESEKVKPKVERKFRCINSSIIAKEQFASLFMPDEKTDEDVEELFAKCFERDNNDEENEDDKEITGEGLGNEIEVEE